MTVEPDHDREFVIDRELAITLGDLRRVLPSVVAPVPVDHLDGAVSVEFVDGRKLTIEYSPERYHTIAALRMPYTALRFRFLGWEETQRLDFMEKFGRAFHKGGG